jgi:hypothetical protein
MLAQLTRESPIYSIIKNGVIIEAPPGSKRRVIQIVCEKDDAERLLDVVKTLCPDAFEDVRGSITPFLGGAR